MNLSAGLPALLKITALSQLKTGSSSDVADGASLALTELRQQLKNHLLWDVDAATRADAVWKYLNKMFSAKDNPSRLIVLRQQLSVLRMKPWQSI